MIKPLTNPNLYDQKKYIKLDLNNYFLNFYTIDESQNPEDVLSAWNINGGSAADGYDSPIIPKDQLIPPNVIFEQPPILTEMCTNIHNFYWTGNCWMYDYTK